MSKLQFVPIMKLNFCSSTVRQICALLPPPWRSRKVGGVQTTNTSEFLSKDIQNMQLHNQMCTTYFMRCAHKLFIYLNFSSFVIGCWFWMKSSSNWLFLEFNDFPHDFISLTYFCFKKILMMVTVQIVNGWLLKNAHYRDLHFTHRKKRKFSSCEI